MADRTEASVGGLVRGALDDVRELFREELLLARAEMREELNKVTASAIRFGVGGVLLWFAGMFVFVTAALGVAAALDWPAWAGFAVMAVLLGITGAVFVMVGRRTMQEVRAMPRTVQTVKENFR